MRPDWYERRELIMKSARRHSEQRSEQFQKPAREPSATQGRKRTTGSAMIKLWAEWKE